MSAARSRKAAAEALAQREAAIQVARGRALHAAEMIASRAAVVAVELRAAPGGNHADLVHAAGRVEQGTDALRVLLREFLAAIGQPAPMGEPASPAPTIN